MPKQMASNPRYPPPGGVQEEVLDTPGLPGRWGWATFIHNSDSNINAKWLKAGVGGGGWCWGSGGRRVGEGEGEGERGRFSQISCICAIKEITA